MYLYVTVTFTASNISPFDLPPFEKFDHPGIQSEENVDIIHPSNLFWGYSLFAFISNLKNMVKELYQFKFMVDTSHLPPKALLEKNTKNWSAGITGKALLENSLIVQQTSATYYRKYTKTTQEDQSAELDRPGSTWELGSKF